jgi:hypothetical protein
MDLRALATTAARIGMGVAGTALERVTLNLGSPGEYDPTSDTMAGGQAAIAVDALPFKPRNRQGSEDVSANTETLQIEAAKLPTGARITEEDTVTRFGTEKWQITAVQNPAGAIWLVDVRR